MFKKSIVSLVTLSAIASLTAIAGGKADLETYAACKTNPSSDGRTYDVYLGYDNSSNSTFNVPAGNPDNFLSPSGLNHSPLTTQFLAMTENNYAVKICGVERNKNITWHVKAPSPATSNEDVRRVDELPNCTSNPIAACGAPLPVELVSFTASVSKSRSDQIDVKWSTAQEKNSDHFDIEDSSDGRSFVKRADQPGHGTTSSAHSYSIVLPARDSGMQYIRLKQVDLDGTFAYSPVRAVSIGSVMSASLSFYPNPVAAGQSANLDVRGAPAGSVIRIIDLSGRTIREIPATSMSFSTEGLKAGTYILKLIGEGISSQSKLVISE